MWPQVANNFEKIGIMSEDKKPTGKKQRSKIHPDLAGFKIELDELGRVKMNMSMDEINTFLKEHMPAKEHGSEAQEDQTEEEEE